MRRYDETKGPPIQLGVGLLSASVLGISLHWEIGDETEQLLASLSWLDAKGLELA